MAHRLSLPLATLWTRAPAPHRPPLAWMLRAVATRRQLARLDDRMLKDIGITRAEALAEAGRAPWDLGPRRG